MEARAEAHREVSPLCKRHKRSWRSFSKTNRYPISVTQTSIFCVFRHTSSFKNIATARTIECWPEQVLATKAAIDCRRRMKLRCAELYSLTNWLYYPANSSTNVMRETVATRSWHHIPLSVTTHHFLFARCVCDACSATRSRRDLSAHERAFSPRTAWCREAGRWRTGRRKRACAENAPLRPCRSPSLPWRLQKRWSSVSAGCQATRSVPVQFSSCNRRRVSIVSLSDATNVPSELRGGREHPRSTFVLPRTA